MHVSSFDTFTAVHEKWKQVMWIIIIKSTDSFSVCLSLYISAVFGVCLARGVWWKMISGFSLQEGGLAASSASTLPCKIHWIFFTPLAANATLLCRFGEFYYNCCLSILPQLACGIHATWTTDFSRSLYKELFFGIIYQWANLIK